MNFWISANTTVEGDLQSSNGDLMNVEKCHPKQLPYYLIELPCTASFSSSIITEPYFERTQKFSIINLVVYSAAKMSSMKQNCIEAE